MVGNVVAEVATRCRAEPADLCAVTLLAGSGGRPTPVAELGVGWPDAAAGSLRQVFDVYPGHSGWSRPGGTGRSRRLLVTFSADWRHKTPLTRACRAVSMTAW